jgi:hypothetical protein
VGPEGERSMTGQWQYQVRFDVNDSATAESMRRKAPDTALAQLFEILARHQALAKCQFDVFAEYVAAAEEEGVESYPLYEWTKANDRELVEEGKIPEVLHDLRRRSRGL